ncbi:MAG: hypothetical protein PHG03_04590 [Bacilli bacterium]|nr:hypothetical protein [Bacilli bacterium]MDD4795815.1 hypothetical protein [Bacilli bacterium]
MIKRVMIILAMLLMTTSCFSNKTTNEFQEIYGVKSDLVNRMSYEEFLSFTEKNTCVVFIGDEDNTTKDLANIFCETLCECDVNKAHFVKTEDITDDKLLEIFEVDNLNYPIIVAYKVGELVGYYDSETKQANLKKYIDDLIHQAYPTVCTDAC